jgi:hypothetical protein
MKKIKKIRKKPTFIDKSIPDEHLTWGYQKGNLECTPEDFAYLRLLNAESYKRVDYWRRKYQRLNSEVEKIITQTRWAKKLADDQG